jgi:DnaJ like chaperone protein
MAWIGKFLGALIGLLTTRSLWGAVVGTIIGHLYDENSRASPRAGAGYASGNNSMSISEEFFRTTFELMGHVAKSDGRVTEAEIDAARRLMSELRLGPHEIGLAIGCFRTGKSPAYDAGSSIESLRDACGPRHDLLRAFMEIQLRAALAGNGISPPARLILARAAERLGMSRLEFAHLEASLRARQRSRGADGGDKGSSRPAAGAASVADFYAELDVDPNISDQELTLAYRRQMSRHHPDKLVANGLPESMAEMAKEKTQRIQEAYEGIRAARGMR